MGAGLPFAVGVKAATPEAQVICLHGDGSFGQNAMELDTAVRHKLPLLCIISVNGGWTADPERNKPGRDLGYTRYDKMAEALGCYYTDDGLSPGTTYIYAKVRAKVEHPIGVIKRVFGFAKVRYRGLRKNAHRLRVACALANLFIARRHLLRCHVA